MYEAYFQLQKRPFSATPDPSCFFAPEPIQELFDELVLRAESGQGIGILTAHAGTGKTLVCRRIAAELGGRFTPIFLANANFPTRRALLQSILFELKKRFSGLEEQELRLAVYASLKELTLAGRGVVLIVDEAHLLNERLLEELRMLASLAEGEEPLARLILAGQTPLEERLAEPALEALNQRIVCHVCLEPLTRRQSVDYVNFRIAWAGGDTAQIFAPQALERIASACNGLPRCLNQLCDHVLLLTCVQELPRVTDDAVREALRDLQQLPLHWNAPVAADTPLDGLGDGPVSSEAAPDNDEIEFAPIVANDVSSAPERGETVCFEIGASEAETGPTTPSIDRFGHPQPSPVSSGRAGRRSFAEEIIDDRYAALDVRSPRVRRTFEDCAVPEDWRSPRQTPVCTAPLPPAPPAGSQPGENRPAEMPGNQFPVQNDAGENVVPPGGSNGDVPEYVSFANLDEGSRLTFDGVEPERQPIEEQLGCSVLDACLEVQAAIGHWHAADGTINSIDHGHGSAIDAGDVIVPAPSNEYDVIEPDSQTTAADVDDAASDAGEIDSRSAGHYVPQPKYRHVFSTLRRRLGRPLIRKG